MAIRWLKCKNNKTINLDQVIQYRILDPNTKTQTGPPELHDNNHKLIVIFINGMHGTIADGTKEQLLDLKKQLDQQLEAVDGPTPPAGELSIIKKVIPSSGSLN